MRYPLLLAGILLVPLLAGEPAAHDPRYDQAGLWPEDVRSAAYARQAWEPAPVYVWSGGGKDGRETDPADAASWTVDGKPAGRAPDEGCDAAFPTGALIRLKEDVRFAIRHLTVERGARITKTLKLRPLGNLWIKEGGRVEQLVLEFGGGKDVFLRNDTKDWREDAAMVANKILFNKPVGSAIEVLGAVKVGDELCFMCGTVVVGPDAILLPGNRSTQAIFPDARLVLMSGSTFQKRGNQPYAHDLVVSGELAAGSAERPLRRDCTLGLSFKAKGRAELVPGCKAGGPDDYGMVINPKGRLAVHSSDPVRARLRITWNGLSSPLYRGASDPDPIPRQVDLVLQGQVNLAGVLFDRIRPGGILIADPGLRKQGAVFGEQCPAPTEACFAALDQPIEAKLVFSAAGEFKPASGREKR